MSEQVQALLARLLERRDLAQRDAETLMHALAGDGLAPALAGAVLTALRMKGETPEEVRGFASVMRQLARRVSLPAGFAAADVVGTGGDDSGSLNISTGAALLAAACGVPVVKHGNRSVSSRSGSADVLEALGVPLVADEEQALACLRECGFAFLFAPNFHPAMKAVAPVRRALGARTVFNILGPLTNPAAPPFSMVGAFDLATARLMAEALSGLPIERAFVVHGEPGWDEATPVGPFMVFDVRPGLVRRQRRNPAHYGLPACSPADLAGGDAAHNAAALEQVLAGTDRGAHRHALVLGAALVLDLTGKARGLRRGIAQAERGIDSGGALALLERLRAFARGRS